MVSLLMSYNKRVNIVLARDSASKNATPTSEKQNKPTVRNYQKTSENTPMSTPTSNCVIKEQEDPLANEGSEDFWNYIDLLLSDDKQKKASLGKTENKESEKYDKPPEPKQHTTVFNSKKSPKKSDLMVEAQQPRATLEELEDDIQVNCPAVRKKVQKEELSQGNSSQRNGSQLRTSVSMPVESDSQQKKKEMVLEKHTIDRLNDYQRTYVPPRKEYFGEKRNVYENSQSSSTKEKSNIQQRLSSEPKENLIMASLSQHETPKKIKESRDSLGKMEDDEQMKLQRLKQIIDDKRVETAKNSVKKSVSKMEVSQEMSQEVKETCSICLSKPLIGGISV